MNGFIVLPTSGQRICLTALKSGDKDNSNALAGYMSNPKNAETALKTMQADQNLVIDLVSAIFRENIGEGERDNIINYLRAEFEFFCKSLVYIHFFLLL